MDLGVEFSRIWSEVPTRPKLVLPNTFCDAR